METLQRLWPRTLATIADAKRMADGYIREEEYQRTFGEPKDKPERRGMDRRRDERPRHERSHKEPTPSPSKDGRKAEKVKGGSPQYQPKYNAYTPLTVSRPEVFTLTKDDDKWKKPKQLIHPSTSQSIASAIGGPRTNTMSPTTSRMSLQILLSKATSQNSKQRGPTQASPRRKNRSQKKMYTKGLET